MFTVLTVAEVLTCYLQEELYRDKSAAAVDGSGD